MFVELSTSYTRSFKFDLKLPLPEFLLKFSCNWIFGIISASILSLWLLKFSVYLKLQSNWGQKLKRKTNLKVSKFIKYCYLSNLTEHGCE